MAKGDNLTPGIGYNPGGPNIGGSATFGSRPPQMGGIAGNAMNGLFQGGVGPSSMPSGIMGNMLGGMASNMGGGNMMRPGVEPMKATGNMIPFSTTKQEMGPVGIGPNPEMMQQFFQSMNRPRPNLSAGNGMGGGNNNPYQV